MFLTVLGNKVPKAKNTTPAKKRGRPPASTSTKLTRRQELFVKELVSKDGQITLREAAINAGYPASSAHTRAYELTNPKISPHVVAAIRAYRDELDAKYGLTYMRHLRDLQRIRDLAIEKENYSAAVMAEYRRGQAHGDIYVSKSEIRTGSIDSMSKEDVLKALEEVKSTYAPITINSQATEIPNENNSGNRKKARERLLPVDEARDAFDGAEGDFDEA